MTLTERVLLWGIEAGFDLVAVAPAAPLKDAEEATLRWLDAGMQGEMGWMNPDRALKACDPQRLLPGARSILVLGKNYLPPEDEDDPATGPSGRIARYARGDDYHDLFPPRLKSLVDRIERETGHRPAARLFVDSSPLAEKAVAARSGIGFFGKNGCIINRKLGSWFLLAEVLTDLDLEPGEPVTPRCGNCTLCMDRCPTGAIVAPGVVDARRCISYLTIELKGPIPRELRPLIGDRIFGCDICQEVCPWNRLRSPNEDEQLLPRKSVGGRPSLIPLLQLDRAGFKEMFKGSPVLRAKRRGFLRNVAVALGNSGDPAAVPALARALLEDEEPLVRGHAAWALGRLGGPEAAVALREAQGVDPDAWVRSEIDLALADMAA